MPREFVTKPAFEKGYRSLPRAERERVDRALRQFELYLETGRAPLGLGLKHLGSKTYEFRAGLFLRIVYVAEKDRITLCLLGTHDEVRRYLK